MPSPFGTFLQAKGIETNFGLSDFLLSALFASEFKEFQSATAPPKNVGAPGANPGTTPPPPASVTPPTGDPVPPIGSAEDPGQQGSQLPTGPQPIPPIGDPAPPVGSAEDPAQQGSQLPTTTPPEKAPIPQLPISEQRKSIISGVNGEDNTTFLGTPYTSPDGAQTIQVTARQLAAMQAWERLQAGTGILTQQQVFQLMAKAFDDPDAPNNRAGAPDDIKTPVPGGDGDDPGAQLPSEPPKPGDKSELPPGVDPNNVPDLLAEFLESDPSLILNHVMNQFREGGASSVFLRWFGGQFNNFYGRYLGYIAEEALAGRTPTLKFVDFMSAFPSTQAFFAESAFNRGDPSARFASFASSSGAQ